MIQVLTKTTVIGDIFFSEGLTNTLVSETIFLLGLRKIDQQLSDFSEGQPLFIRVGGSSIHFDERSQELVVPLSTNPEELVNAIKKQKN